MKVSFVKDKVLILIKILVESLRFGSKLKSFMLAIGIKFGRMHGQSIASILHVVCYAFFQAIEKKQNGFTSDQMTLIVQPDHSILESSAAAPRSSILFFVFSSVDNLGSTLEGELGLLMDLFHLECN